MYYTFNLLFVLIIVLLLVKERPFVVGTVRIEPRDRHTWKKK